MLPPGGRHPPNGPPLATFGVSLTNACANQPACWNSPSRAPLPSYRLASDEAFLGPSGLFRGFTPVDPPPDGSLHSLLLLFAFAPSRPSLIYDPRRRRWASRKQPPRTTTTDRARSVRLSVDSARALSLSRWISTFALLRFASLVPVGDGSDTPRRRTMGYRTWNFDIDRYLNPLVPSPPWRHLPYPVAYWFGYRKGKPREMGNLVPIFWAFIGVFGAILLIEGVSRHVPSFEHKGVPMIVGSFGAAAVLEFYSIEAPLAQPRNAIVGQLIAAVIGVSVGKLFQLSDRFADIQWVGGALSCASATALMALTKTVHPPAGATALLAVVDANLIRIGWFLIPVMMLGCALMLGVALLVNNVERRFPMYWWTPEALRPSKPAFVRRKSDEEMNVAAGAEKGAAAGDASHRTAVSDGEGEGSSTQQDQDDMDVDDDDSEGNRVMFKRVSRSHQHAGEVVIKPGQVIVPEHMFLTQEEEQLLETMSYRL
ncbi:hypothetical protein Purlil1_2957 [Purpureocillium lilacinum]|uniref:HPP transmembrane region domain-containing protein n=1 Tax=Purpureocillium lilacinum TaxID=33203 RepID=A0ABR0C9T3_PURLI|nr:hypothetical protein Purlil1_2957 [Purpureocillium lilacinum]